MFGLKRREYVVMDAQADDLDEIAELHAVAFPRGWSGAEFANLASQRGVHVLVARQVGAPESGIAAFNLVRQSGEEAEILSIAVDPKFRRAGLGDQLMREAILRLRSERVPKLFLEVDATNVAAVHLYEKLGFGVVGTRPGYYRKISPLDPSDQATALVMRLDLG